MFIKLGLYPFQKTKKVGPVDTGACQTEQKVQEVGGSHKFVCVISYRLLSIIFRPRSHDDQAGGILRGVITIETI
jgi:hypothetical protein